MHFREITPADVPATFLVRAAAKENPMPLSGLASLGITVESVNRHLATTHKGFVCEIDGLVVGFVVADSRSGELWVLAVWPEHEGKGIGRRLMILAQNWLWSQGYEKLWLTTGIAPTRAFHLYTKLGWKIVGKLDHGGSYRMELHKSH